MNATDGTPNRSRFLTSIGWILLLIGISILIRLILNYFKLIPMIRFTFGLDTVYRASAAIGMTLKLLISGLGIWAGIMIIRRRPWAPSAVCVAAGATLTDALDYIYTWAPIAIRSARVHRNTKYFGIALDFGVPVLIEMFVAGCWLVALATVMKRKWRDEFEKDAALPVSSLWACLLLSALICGGFLALEQMFFLVNEPIR